MAKKKKREIVGSVKNTLSLSKRILQKLKKKTKVKKNKNPFLKEKKKKNRFLKEKKKKVKKPKKKELKKLVPKKHLKTIKQQREVIKKILDKPKPKPKSKPQYIKTGIEGFDDLLEKGIPRGNTILIAGGAGSGKTIFCLQTMYNKAKKGHKCLYMSFEEPEERLKQHLRDFKMEPEKYIKKGLIKIQRFNPFDISRSVDALLTKAKGELLIDVEPVLLPSGFKPDFIFLDSLTAIASAFTGKEDSYRIYIEQLFRFFEQMDATTFLITETEQIPKIFSPTGVEEFLADGVVVLYNFKRGIRRENAIEILKLRGANHEKKIVTMQILPGIGIKVFPQQEIYGDFGGTPDIKIK
ncbi:hypothetical protein D6777_04695 [Candidatus Woesearchaeota archaeon]|nr:MAG: hypothetical protein D6777_04695 [Candidatus Woesearchaeota archaeon]